MSGTLGAVAVSSGRDVQRVSRIPRAGGAARLALLAVVGVAAALVSSPGAIAATTYNCDASAVRGTVLGAPIEPVTANRGAPQCRSATAGGSGIGLPPPARGALAPGR